VGRLNRAAGVSVGIYLEGVSVGRMLSRAAEVSVGRLFFS
jgi:hypothetical protein